MTIKQQISVDRFNIWVNGLKNYIDAAEKNPEAFVGFESLVEQAKTEFAGVFRYCYIKEHECNLETGVAEYVWCSLTDDCFALFDRLSEYSLLNELVDYSPILVNKLRERLVERDARCAKRERIAAEKNATVDVELEIMEVIKGELKTEYAFYLADATVLQHTKADFARRYGYVYDFVLSVLL